MENEKRLIDANEALLRNDTMKNRSDVFRSYAKVVIDGTPTVDAVEVVRCKDCKHYNQTMNECESLHFWFSEDGGLNVKEDDFCSYGEKREV